MTAEASNWFLNYNWFRPNYWVCCRTISED